MKIKKPAKTDSSKNKTTNQSKIRDFCLRVLKKDRLSLSRCISIVEGRLPDAGPILGFLYSHTGNAYVVGITGPPGAGKSSVTDRLVSHIRKQNKSVAVVAIDPSSPFSGGALLGDRVRMQNHFNDPNVFIRSLGTRGQQGGLSFAARDVVTVLDAAGFDWIIVETAGVGQTELDVLKIAHAVTVVLVPESGDGIQMMKAGLMEIADIFVLNKCDRPEADKVAQELIVSVHMASNNHPAHSLSEDSPTPTKSGQKTKTLAEKTWTIPVIKTQAIFDQGIDQFLTNLSDYKAYLQGTDLWTQKRKRFIQKELTEIIEEKTNNLITEFFNSSNGQALVHKILNKKSSPQQEIKKISQYLTKKI